MEAKKRVEQRIIKTLILLRREALCVQHRLDARKNAFNEFLDVTRWQGLRNCAQPLQVILLGLLAFWRPSESFVNNLAWGSSR